MKVARIDTKHKINIHSDSFSVYSGDVRLFRFWVATPVNTENETDIDKNITLISNTDREFIWESQSNIWIKKQYKLQITGSSYVFSVKIFGKGKPCTIEYFKGSDNFTGSHFAVAGYTLFNCQEYDRERSKFLINKVPAVLECLRACPPPYVFPFHNDMNEEWTGIGIVAKKGQHNFEKLTFNAPKNGWNENGCWFTLDTLGYTDVKSEWETPYILGNFGRDDMDILKKYSDWQYENLGFEKNIPDYLAPKWWKGPIFCGWGAQGQLSSKNFDNIPTKDFANQNVYNMFIDRLNNLDLHPSVIIIDDKWQKEYGTLTVDNDKWYDLRAFADENHNNGRKVLLWFKCWNPEGLPEDECIKLNGEIFSADPTNPKYLERLQKGIYKLLSDDDGCYNCDGFKVDFMDNHPRSSGAECYEKGVFGVELIKRMIENIYKFAKTVKFDALINTSSAHPYFSNICDQFRIHDYDANLRSYKATMQFRRDLAKAVMPDILVDMDGFHGYTEYENLHCFKANAETGVPDLYYFPDNFSDEDWEKCRKLWNEYSSNI